MGETLRIIVDEPPHTFDNVTRQGLIQELVDDLASCPPGDKASRLTRSDAPAALLAVKTLGRIPQGADVVGKPANLRALLSVAESFADAPDARNEAWRCIANTLLLIEAARATWTGADVSGGEATVRELLKTSDPDYIFLLSRTLFLSTLSPSTAASFIRSLVEDSHSEHGTVIDTIALRLVGLSNGILAGQRMSREATSELLKAVFNLLIHYPRVAEGIVSPNTIPQDDEYSKWDERLNSILPPLLHLFNTLPPSFPSPLSPPLTHVIHALITVPVSPALRSTWFVASPSGGNSPTVPPGSSPTGSERSSTPTKQSTLDRALSVLGRRSLQGRNSPPSAPQADTLSRAYDLLEMTFAHFLPGQVDPDDQTVRDRVKLEADSTLDELVVPLVVLLTRLCVADEGCRKRLSEKLFPADLDRTGAALESRPDTLGRCLRLLGSVYAARMKDAMGEMLYTICNSDAGLLVAQVGYGNVAGFLYSKGLMSAPPRSDAVPSTTSGGEAINPITGLAYKQTEGPEMTDEEKEREAEKLFVLFDRLEKNGAIQPSQNPVRKAMQEQQRREG